MHKYIPKDNSSKVEEILMHCWWVYWWNLPSHTKRITWDEADRRRRRRHFCQMQTKINLWVSQRLLEIL